MAAKFGEAPGAPGTSGRPEWTSQRAFVIASVASAVGLGNLWRFPYMVGENGGGTFIVAYGVCILAVGLPLFILETSAGSLVERGPVGLFRRTVVGGKWLGWFIALLALVLMSYYFVITGWTLGYFIDAVRGNLLVFDDFTSGYNSVWYFLVVGVLVFLVVMRGLGSVERLSKFLLPALALMVGSLAISAQILLPGSASAWSFYLTFDASRFQEPHLWQMAAGQAFFSLGVGTGVLITYGSYVPRNINIVTSSLAVAVTNSAISLTAGIMVFSIVYTFGIAPDSGSSLSFTAFPRIFDDLSGGRILAPVFFGLLFVAAFSSCYSTLIVVVTPLRDEFGFSNTVAALLATGGTIALGIPSALSFTPVDLAPGGQPLLDWIDQIVGSGVIVVVGLTGAALIAWRLPKSRLVAEMTAGEWRVGSVRLSPYGLVEVCRYMPAAAAALLLLAAIV